MTTTILPHGWKLQRQGLEDKSELRENMSATFVVYIDESGDEGFSFGKGSSDWFVLSAVITRKATDLKTVKLIDHVRNMLGKPDKKPLHFRDLKHEQRLPFVAEIARVDLKTASVLVFKPLLKEPEKFRERYRLYFYAVRYLFERVSWYCRDHRTAHDIGDGSAEIVFSNRSGMSHAEIGEYLEYLKKHTGLFDVRIHWPALNPKQISAYSPGRRMGLQIADAVASSFYYAVQKSNYGFTEDRYACLLKPVVYHRNGIFQGYGLKLWPKELETFMEKGMELKWINEYAGPRAQEPTH